MTAVAEMAPIETMVHVVPLNDMPRATARRQLSHDSASSASSAKRAVRTFARATARRAPAPQPANALSRVGGVDDWERDAGGRADEQEADLLDWTLCDDRASRTGSERVVRRRDSLKKAARRFTSFRAKEAQSNAGADADSGAGKKTGAVLRAVGRGLVRCGEAWAMWGMMTPARHRAWSPERG